MLILLLYRLGKLRCCYGFVVLSRLHMLWLFALRAQVAWLCVFDPFENWRSASFSGLASQRAASPRL